MYFSPSKIAFINLVAWDDCIRVDDAVFNEISAKLAAGTHKLVAVDGQPVAKELPPTPAPGAEYVLAERLQELNIDYETASKALHGSYPLLETITWDKQIAEAQLMLDASGKVGEPAPKTPFLDSLHARRVEKGFEETKIDLAVRILDLSDQLAPALGTITAERQVAERALHEAAKAEDPITAIRAVTWSFNLS